MNNLTGQCLCQVVKFSLPDDFIYAFYCHCSECRRFSGSPFSAAGGIAKERLVILSGEKHLKYYRKREAANMVYCELCGSSLFSDNFSKGLSHIRLGTLNEAPSLKPQMHVFVDSKASWYEINDDLPQFNTMPIQK